MADICSNNCKIFLLLGMFFVCCTATTTVTKSIIDERVEEAVEPARKGHKEPLGQQGADYKNVTLLKLAPSGKDFYQRYARKSKPVVIRNGITYWPAFKKWKDLQTLGRTHEDENFNVEFRKKFKNAFPVRKSWKLSKFVEEYQTKPIYLDSVFSKGSSMMDDVLLPAPLQCKNASFPIDNLNLLISSGNTSSAFHQDGYENLLSVVSGVKEVILYDSKYTRLFDADNFTVAAGVSSIDPESVDLNAYPVMADVPYFRATLNPGDMLYIPQYWWHQVRSYHDPNVAVGIWFNVFNFDEEFQKRQIDDIENVIKTTETFRELLEKEPLEIKCG